MLSYATGNQLTPLILRHLYTIPTGCPQLPGQGLPAGLMRGHEGSPAGGIAGGWSRGRAGALRIRNEASMPSRTG